MNDKDRLGDKLRDKGKAAEDLYIAEQERQRLARLKQAAAPGGTGLCPKDGAKLVEQASKGVTIDVCPTCEGIWLDKGELEVVASQEDEAAVIGWVRSLFSR